MIPYNPSSFNSNKTILEQILELKRWLQDHPSYEIFYSSEAGNTSQAITSYDLTAVTDPTNMEIGDVVVFHNSTFGVVTSVDRDNNEFGCDACISLAGPTGPQGPTGVSITNVSVNASNHLICTLSNGTTIDAGVIQYDTYISLTGNSGTLTDDEYAKALLNDTKILASVSTTTFIYTKYGEDSSSIVYTILIPIDINPSPKTTITNISINKSTHAWTKTSSNLPIGIDNIKSGAYSVNRCVKSDGDGASYWGFIEGSEIKSTGVTSGKVLQADGSGGASWEDTSGGLVDLEITYSQIGSALSDAEYTQVQNADIVIVNYGGGDLLEYTRDSESSTEIKFARMYGSGIDVIAVNKTTKVVTNPTNKLVASDLSSGSATSGQVLQADGNGGASWQNAGGGGSLYQHNIRCYKFVGTSSAYEICFSIISTSSQQLTSASDIASILNTGSGTSKFIFASGFYAGSPSNIYIVSMVYTTDGTTLQVNGLKTNAITLSGGQIDSTYTIIDNVIQIM
jgi:hypothetical protein